MLVTGKLRSYGVAHRERMASVEHRSHKGLNRRAENSHQPTRQCERAMKYFRSPGAAQRFLSDFSGISTHFRPRRHLLTVAQHRFEMTLRLGPLGPRHRQHRPARRVLTQASQAPRAHHTPTSPPTITHPST